MNLLDLPQSERYFEDYVPGTKYEFGAISVSEKEIIEFASRYDAQSFHTDVAAAKESIYGGIIASGWHTGTIMMRMLVEEFLSSVAGMGSPGMDELRWIRPVRGGDVLSCRLEITEARVSQSKPDRGIVRYDIEVINQDKQVVMSAKTLGLIGTRAGGTAT